MSDSRFLRKAKTSFFLDNDDSPLLQLLRDMFIETGAEYNVKELASEFGLSVFSLYKIFAGDRPLRAEMLVEIIRFVHRQDAADTRLLDYICEPCGYTPMPSGTRINNKLVREILARAMELTKED